MIAIVSLASCKLLEGDVEQNTLDWLIANYSGVCACPFSVDVEGNLCGTQSAYTQGAADAPICYVSEVTYDMIVTYLASQ